MSKFESDHHISFLPDPEDPKSKQPEGPSYGSVVAWVFVINYVLGVGILGMPYAFYQAGVLLSSVLIIFITILTIIATMWLVEVGSRAQALFSAGQLDLPIAPADERSRILNNTSQIQTSDIEPRPFESAPSSRHSTLNHPNYTSTPQFQITSTKFEINQLAGVFLGPVGKLFYEICIVLYMLGTLWSYTAVFSSSMTAFVPFPGLSWDRNCNLYDASVPWVWDCEWTYLIFIGLYAIIVLPLACMSLVDQQWIQIILCALRWVGLFVMYTTVLLSMFYHSYDEDPKISGPPYLADKVLARPSGFGIIFTTAVFSQLIQHSTPGLVQPIKNKNHLARVFAGGLAATCTLYIILGVLCATYFGSHTHQVASLNWVNYKGLKFSPAGSTFWLAKGVSVFVVLFPVITVVSAFPLMAITLGNNIFFGLPPHWTNNGKNTKLQLIIRIGACIPPLIGACLLKKLAVIIEFTGMSGFFVGFIIPGVLQYVAKRKCLNVFGEQGRTTPYTSFYSNIVFVAVG
eukprot:TRINITY_DN911_c1_g2_i2.p1 TRINITY_DN911_c1_g2~~TRINITY_DN911_c1_g2_i2.p1  ORF type:complete len:545 (+),score=82.65 TRINITY_DN911_c1_g2_i2:88-1635(+)